MINDEVKYELDYEFNDLMRNGEAECWTKKKGLIDFIKHYIETMEIERVGVTIVYNNAKAKLGGPSGEGTMSNLYNMFYYLMHMMED